MSEPIDLNSGRHVCVIDEDDIVFYIRVGEAGPGSGKDGWRLQVVYERGDMRFTDLAHVRVSPDRVRVPHAAIRERGCGVILTIEDRAWLRAVLVDIDDEISRG